jgi:peptidyl-tRNA hydrolase, PTH1 family
MTIIFGLGNDENKYLETKHNIGRIVVENLAQKCETGFLEIKGCSIAKTKDFWFVFSNGNMNNIGEPLAEVIKYYKMNIIQNFDLIVVQDDSDQIAGNSKLCVGGGSAGHNGIISIYREMSFLGLEQNKIWRLKVGIRPEGNKLKSETFVLSKNSNEDVENSKIVTNKLFLNLDLIKNNNFDKLQKIINTKG